MIHERSGFKPLQTVRRKSALGCLDRYLLVTIASLLFFSAHILLCSNSRTYTDLFTLLVLLVVDDANQWCSNILVDVIGDIIAADFDSVFSHLMPISWSIVMIISRDGLPAHVSDLPKSRIPCVTIQLESFISFPARPHAAECVYVLYICWLIHRHCATQIELVDKNVTSYFVYFRALILDFATYQQRELHLSLHTHTLATGMEARSCTQSALCTPCIFCLFYLSGIISFHDIYTTLLQRIKAKKRTGAEA